MAKSAGRRGYNAYLRKAKKRYGLTHSQARKMYRLQSDKAGTPINSRELDKHPVVSKRLAVAAAQPEKRSKKLRAKSDIPSKGTARSVRTSSPGAASAGGPKATPAVSRRANTIRQWDDYYDQADDYEDIEINAGVDTGKSKGK